MLLCPLLRADESSSYVERITRAKVFTEPLLWVGDREPSEAESEPLWQALEATHTERNRTNSARFEEYIQQHPDSPWGPSLRANLAVGYRTRGRYTLALEHWEAGWLATKHAKSGNAKRVADFILVNWTMLLSSLGRMDSLEEIMQVAENRNLENLNWQPSFNRVRSGLELMRKHPESSFKCGTLALFEVGKACHLTNPALWALPDLPSPRTGFSLASLAELAERYELKLVPVRRSMGKAIAVPSVVHWRQNHYAAIIAQNGTRYHVKDPTFGGSRWLAEEVINAEASGYFLVPANHIPEGWERMAPSAITNVFGRGLNYGPPTAESPPCPDEGQDLCDCRDSGGPGGSGGGCVRACGPPGGPIRGAGGSSIVHGDERYVSPGKGVPVWEVTDPYISLWLHDKPMLYHTSVGTEVALRLSYHLDDTRPDDTNVFNFGPYWSGNWLSFIDIEDQTSTPPDLLFTNYEAHVYGAAGGKRVYSWHDTELHYGSFTRIERIDDGTALTSVRIHYPNGSIWTYGLLLHLSDDPARRRLFLTEQLDPQGRSTRFEYTTNGAKTYLNFVVDIDGRTNSLSYNTNTAMPTQVLAITNAFGQIVSFQYDTNRLLTNLIDVIQLTNSFQYLFTNSIYVLTNLTTPYGSTGFEYVNPAGALYGEVSTDDINRAIRVTEPNGAKHLFVYRDHTPVSPARTDGPTLPCDYPDPPTNGYVNWVGNDCGDATLGEEGGFCNYNMKFRNSFYWGPRQHINLSTEDILLMTQADYNNARLKNWLHEGGLEVSQTLNMDRDFSPVGGASGQKTWYAYHGQDNWHYQGTNLLPRCVGQVLPTGETRYVYREYNHLGRTTLEKTSFSDGAGIAYRTNLFEYATNYNDLIRQYDPSSHLVQSNAYNAYHQVLTNFNALNEVTVYTYNADQQVTSIKTPAGLTITNIYNGDGYLEKTIEIEINRTNSYTYTNGLVSSHTDERGLSMTNIWDNLQRLVSTAYPDGSYISNRYTHLDLTATKDRLGYWTYFSYNTMRQRTAVTNALNNVTLYSYCTCGALDSVRDPLNNYTYFYYDNLGRTTNVVYPGGSTITNRYNLIGQLTNTTDSAGVSVTNWYNHQGLLAASSNAFGRVSVAFYDIEDRATNTVDANGVSITNTFDDLGRIKTRTYPDGGTEKFGYSARGLTAYTNQLTKVTYYAYDEAGRKTAETNANSEITQFKYDASGNLTNLIDGKSQNTFWKYDLEGRVTNKIDHLGTNLFFYSYDANSRLISRVSAAKGTTAYAYDAVGNLTSINYPSSTDITLAYDANNRLTNMVDAAGTNRYGYTVFGALSSEDGPWDNDTVSYTYDNGRRRNGLSLLQPNASAWSQSYGYDAASRLSSITSPAGAFTYTLGGASSASPLIKKLTLPNGAYITNGYDNVARLTTNYLKNSSHTILNSHLYANNSGNQRTKQTRTDGSYDDYTYDNIGQLATALGTESGGVTNRLNEQFRYTYDKAGNLSNRVQNLFTNFFNVNNLNQLTTGTRGGNLTVAGTTSAGASNVTVNTSTAILYADNTFARTNVTLSDGNNTFTAIAKDNLGRQDTNAVTVNLPATLTFSYDGNGNLTNDGRRAFFYDDENQLTNVTISGVSKSEFIYDGKMRRRVRKEYLWQNSAWALSNEVRYVYDASIVIQERDANNLPAVSYTRGRDLSGSLEGAGGIGGLLARTSNPELQTPNLASAHAYYHADGNGNVTALISTNQVLIAKYLFDPFGNIISMSGPLAEANLYRFSSKEAHPNSGLVYYLYRYYDPNLQRWPNQDPLGDEVLLRQASKGLNPIIVAMLRREALANPYGFVHNTPLNAVDPDGQTTIVIGGGVIVVGGVIVSVWVCYAIPECRQALEKLGKGILDLLRDACKGPERPKSEKCELTNDFDDYNIDPPIKRCIYKCPSQKLPVQRAFPAGTPCEKTITQPIP